MIHEPPGKPATGHRLMIHDPNTGADELRLWRPERDGWVISLPGCALTR